MLAQGCFSSRAKRGSRWSGRRDGAIPPRPLEPADLRERPSPGGAQASERHWLAKRSWPLPGRRASVVER